MVYPYITLSLCFNFPFGFRDKYGSEDSLKIVRNRIEQGNFNQQGAWQNLSNPCQSFIRSMFTHEPAKRPSAEELLNHAWFTSTDDQNKVCAQLHYAVSPTDESILRHYESMFSLN